MLLQRFLQFKLLQKKINFFKGNMEIVNLKTDPIHLALRGKRTLSHPSGPLITAYPPT